MTDYDVVVIGLGIMGTAVAYQAARRGLKTLGLEQMPQIGHAMGSSHGQTRIIRQAYFEHPTYVPLIQEAWNEWEELQRLTGQSLLIQCGGFMLGHSASEIVTGARTSARDYHLPYEIWDAAQIHQRFPAFALAPDEVGVWDPMAGYLNADLCLHGMANYATRHGVTLKTRQTVTNIISHSPERVEIVTPDDRYVSRVVILTVGPWVANWSAQWAISVERQVPFWFDAPDLRDMDHYPVFIHENRLGQHTYGFPYIEGQGLKTALHHGGVITTPDTVTRQVSKNDETLLKDRLDFLPRIQPHNARHAEVCLYTNSADSHFIIGRHPHHHPNVVIGAGFSGHGFKFAPAIGRLLLDLALNKVGEFPIFSPQRPALKGV